PVEPEPEPEPIATVEPEPEPEPIAIVAPEPDPAPEPATPTGPVVEPVVMAELEHSREQADARAERWHAELEQVREELTLIAAARDAAEGDASDVRAELDAVRDMLARTRAELEQSRAAADTNEAEASARVADLESTEEARVALDERLRTALDEIEALRASVSL